MNLKVIASEQPSWKAYVAVNMHSLSLFFQPISMQ